MPSRDRNVRVACTWRTLSLGALLLLAMPMFAPYAAAQPGSRLSDREIRALVAGKSIVIRTGRAARGTAAGPEFFERTDGGSLELTFVVRTDGSYRRLCKAYSRGVSVGRCGGVFGEVGTGVWEVRSASLCLRDIVAGAGGVTCYGIQPLGKRYRFHLNSGGVGTGAIRAMFDGTDFEIR